MCYRINIYRPAYQPIRRDDFIPNKRFVNHLPNNNSNIQWNPIRINNERYNLIQILKSRGTRVNQRGLNVCGLNLPYRFDYHQTNPGELDRLLKDPNSHIIIPDDLKDTFSYLDLYQGTKLGDKKRENHGGTYYGPSYSGGMVYLPTTTQWYY